MREPVIEIQIDFDTDRPSTPYRLDVIGHTAPEEPLEIDSTSHHPTVAAAIAGAQRALTDFQAREQWWKRSPGRAAADRQARTA